ncbi:MAG: hypothetical protein M3Y44_06805 [Actinomycetota bacterium]|nr:hypothetical protein [Actinomycetota bacterium]
MDDPSRKDEPEPQPKAVAERLATLTDNSPGVHDVALEVGVIDRHWLEQPSQH